MFLTHYEYVVSRAFDCAPFPGMATDIVQEVYMDFVKKFEFFEIKDDIRPLFSGMVKIAAMRVREKYAKEQPKTILRIAEKLLLHREQSKSQIDNEFDRLEFEALRACIDQLPEVSRSMVSKHYFEDVKMAEIAKESGRPENTVRQMFCRIREKLRKCIIGKIGGKQQNMENS